MPFNPLLRNSGLCSRRCTERDQLSCFKNLVLLSAVLKLKAVDRGVVVIEGTEAGRYLAMSDEGRLYGSVSIYKTSEDPCAGAALVGGQQEPVPS